MMHKKFSITVIAIILLAGFAGAFSGSQSTYAADDQIDQHGVMPSEANEVAGPEAFVGAYSGNPGISIDGNFDDWNDIEKTEIMFPGEDFDRKQMTMVQHGDYLYLYVNRSPYAANGNTKPLQRDNYLLHIGGRKYTMRVTNEDKSDYVPLSNVGDSKPVNMKIVDEDDSQANSIGFHDGVEGYVSMQKTATGGLTSVFEMRIPMSVFGEASDGQTMTLENKSLGNQTVTVAGGSTGPYLLASGGLAIALFGAGILRRRRRIEA